MLWRLVWFITGMMKKPKFFKTAYLFIEPKGRLITFNGVLVENQSVLARCFLKNNQGQNVRQRREYEALASSHLVTAIFYLTYDQI